jgi:uncharacterized protein YkwD
MINLPTKKLFYFLIVIVIFTSFSISTQAFSLNLNPVSFIQKTTGIIVNRVSDIIYYLIMQKKYIFDNYEDQNNYQNLNIPTNIEQVLSSSTISTPVITSNTNSALTNPLKPIMVTTSTIPNMRNVNVAPIAQAPNLIVASAPILVSQPSPVTEPEVKVTNNYHNNSQILLSTNIERENASLEPLLPNKILDQAAALRADDLFDNQYFEHDSPDGKSASDLVKNLDYGYLLIGENLALGNFTDEQEIVSAWMESPGHRANILNGKYKELGVAIKEGIFDGERVTIAVQIFANPLSDCAKPNSQTKKIIDEATVSIKQMQSEAALMFNNLERIKNDYSLDRTYYNQKIQEYNYFAKKVNDAVVVLKNLVDNYNAAVAKYNYCISS